MNRIVLVGGTSVVAMGVASLLPAMVRTIGIGHLESKGYAVVSVAAVLILGGVTLVWRELRKPRTISVPAPVRMAMAGNILFVAFCALETSDGLLRHVGRPTYWTSVLFVPALVLLYGQVAAKRWAWWTARVVTALLIVWFVVFIVLMPVAPLRTNGVPVPWWGRVYMEAVTVVFASAAFYAFRSLGRTEARQYFNLPTRTSSLNPYE